LELNILLYNYASISAEYQAILLLKVANVQNKRLLMVVCTKMDDLSSLLKIRFKSLQINAD